jgi:DNA-binding LacI/PurR family transcriptional regulator
MRRYGRDVVNQMVAIFLPRYFYKANYFAQLMEGIMDALTEHDFIPVIIEQGVDDNPLNPLPPVFHNSEVDGVIIYGGGAMIEKLRAAQGFGQRPIVSIVIADASTPLVAADDEHGAYLATKHLLELGHRHIQSWFNKDNGGHVMALRRAGVLRALREWHLDPAVHLHDSTWYMGSIIPPNHLVLPDAEHRDNTGFHSEEQDEYIRYMRAHPEITAILANNDAYARRIWYLLRREGWRIPDDISIVGYDDTDPMPNDHGSNILTSVHIPLVEVGRRAGAQLIHCVLDRADPAPRLVLPPTLQVRASTAPPRGA